MASAPQNNLPVGNTESGHNDTVHSLDVNANHPQVQAEPSNDTQMQATTATNTEQRAPRRALNTKFAEDNYPPYSRVFVVCSHNLTEEDLRTRFAECGDIQYVKLLRDKFTDESRGIGYIKFYKASAAALAIESLNGYEIQPRGTENASPSNETEETTLKVTIAAARSSKIHADYFHTRARPNTDAEYVNGPEDLPPRSRLFVVLNKEFTNDELSALFSPFGDFEFAHVIKDKGPHQSKRIAFVKFAKASTAARAMETLSATETDLKILIADPKAKRPFANNGAMFPPAMIPAPFPFNFFPPLPHGRGGHPRMPIPPPGHEYFSTFPPFGAYGFPPQPLGHTRLFVKCDPQVTANDLQSLFGTFPDLLLCDLKCDRDTNQSKGFAYITFATPHSANLAKQQLNGSEIRGTHIQIQFAAPYTPKAHRKPVDHEAQNHATSFDSWTSPAQTQTSTGAEYREHGVYDDHGHERFDHPQRHDQYDHRGHHNYERYDNRNRSDYHDNRRDHRNDDQRERHDFENRRDHRNDNNDDYYRHPDHNNDDRRGRNDNDHHRDRSDSRNINRDRPEFNNDGRRQRYDNNRLDRSDFNNDDRRGRSESNDNHDQADYNEQRDRPDNIVDRRSRYGRGDRRNNFESRKGRSNREQRDNRDQQQHDNQVPPTTQRYEPVSTGTVPRMIVQSNPALQLAVVWEVCARYGDIENLKQDAKAPGTFYLKYLTQESYEAARHGLNGSEHHGAKFSADADPWDVSPR